VDVDSGGVGAEVAYRHVAHATLLTPALVDVSAEHEPRLLVLDRAKHRCAPVSTVDVPVRRRVDEQHGAYRQRSQPALGVLVAEIEAPVPGRLRDPAAEPENVTPSTSAASPCSTVAFGQAGARVAQCALGLIVAGTSSTGRSIVRTASIMSSGPRCIDARSPTAATTSRARGRCTTDRAPLIAMEDR
jgi:hypothetical protein